MGLANNRKKTNNKLVFNQDPKTHLIQLQRLVVVKIKLNC